MKYRDYRKLRQRTHDRMFHAREAGADAVRSGDSQAMVAACYENDAAYLADCAAQDQLRLVDDLPFVEEAQP